MKILMLSIFAPHFFNWTEQLKDSGHEVYWLDIYDSDTKVEQIEFAEQITGWRYKWNYPGRYIFKKKAPGLTRFVNIFNERKFLKVFNEILEKIKPDIVHSFVLFQAVVPVFESMKARPDIKWVYSSWGSDLYYYENRGVSGENIKKVLPHIDYMFSDCKRDYEIAKRNGFSGKFLGEFPGGGGYDFKKTDALIKPINERNTILVKGYQGKHGRCLEVLKSIENMEFLMRDKKIVVFGADSEILNFISVSNIKFKDKIVIYNKIEHSQVMKLMGESLVYIGNSMSDGMPNTLLEAIVMGAYPIQSNPGGATAELITHGTNGLLIEDPENTNEIRDLILKSLNDKRELQLAMEHNFKYIKPFLEREYICQQVLEKYQYIEEQVHS